MAHRRILEYAGVLSLKHTLKLNPCKRFIATTGVVMGAFGAHGLRNRTGVKPEQIQAFQTASQYAVSAYMPQNISFIESCYAAQMFNGLSLFVISMHPRFSTHFAGTLITTGSVLFSGSIWGLVVLNDDRYGNECCLLQPACASWRTHS
jgi:uncharacterized membrane protein YgdD (TMEM256/DUF423 family)